MFNIKEYHRILKEYDIKEKEGHLLMEGNPTLIRKVTKLLLSALGDTRCDEPIFMLQRLPRCPHKNCVSPQCNSFILKKNSVKSLLTKEDIVEIASEMDLNEIEELGAKEYLKKYNESLPDVLKISSDDFKTVYAYMKGLK